MGYKRTVLEAVVWSVSRCVQTEPIAPASPSSIIVLRNNDIGDLLVVTPLFEALRRCFPNARITAGIGDWNRPVLENNPHVSETIAINAPWHNKFVTPQTPWNALKYILFSSETKTLTTRKAAVGIDVLGSPFGSLLLMRAGIPYRLGVRGYAGGYTGVQSFVDYNPNEHVGRSALRFAELLGATRLPENRPQIFLNKGEQDYGENIWSRFGERGFRIVIGSGGGFHEKCWPLENFRALACHLAHKARMQLIIVGGKQDVEAASMIASAAPGLVDLSGKLTLRETFAVVAKSDLVLCNSSMLMHVGAAFNKQSVVLLGEHFNDAIQHAKQWGYGAHSTVLGKCGAHPVIATIDDGLRAVERLSGMCTSL